MRNPIAVLNSLSEKSQNKEYRFERLYRNLYNPEFYLLAYKNIYANDGSMTVGADGSTIDGMSSKRIENIIAKIKDKSYQPNPARRTYIEKKNSTKKQTTFSYKLKNKKLLPQNEWSIAYNAHKPIIEKQDFDLVQKLMNIDTRTAPNEDNVYLFSGILICGCCGTRMTRKTVPYKDKKYYYYFCPKGKKNGCTGSKMIKETELIGCITDSVKMHINNVLSLDELLSSLTEKKITHKVFEKYTIQLQDIQNQIDKISIFKTGMYESMLDGIISKSEFTDMKKQYDFNLVRLNGAKAVVTAEYEKAKANEDEKMRWIKHFKNFSEMENLSRSAIVQLIQHITIGADMEIHIKFRYQAEFDKALKILNSQRKAV